MLDFNSSTIASARMSALIDTALVRHHRAQEPRHYLGASQIGGPCERAVQYGYVNAPVDPDKETPGRILRIFHRGHVMEDCMAVWLLKTGFELRTRAESGEQIGFSALDGRLKGHVDGVIVSGPAEYRYPAIWENKCLGNKAWKEVVAKGVARAKPIYHAQIVIYQAFLGLQENPAIFTALNADTMEIYTEQIRFDARLAEQISERAQRIIETTERGEQLPRGFTDLTHVECAQCSWQKRCWRPNP
jgi:hypothetical protein